MHVRVDVARHDHLPARVHDARARADHVVAGADVRDAFAADGDAGRIELPGVDVEQRSAAHVEIGVRAATRDVGETPTLSDGHGGIIDATIGA